MQRFIRLVLSRASRDRLTDDFIASLGLNDRQIVFLRHLKTERHVSTSEYQALVGCAKRTAVRDLEELMKLGLIARVRKARPPITFLEVKRE